MHYEPPHGSSDDDGHCLHCNGHVSERFQSVFGDEDDVARAAVREIRREVLGIPRAYMNCWRDYTRTAVLEKLSRDLVGAAVPRSSTSTGTLRSASRSGRTDATTGRSMLAWFETIWKSGTRSVTVGVSTGRYQDGCFGCSESSASA
jgi:hypothetical protein